MPSFSSVTPIQNLRAESIHPSQRAPLHSQQGPLWANVLYDSRTLQTGFGLRPQYWLLPLIFYAFNLYPLLWGLVIPSTKGQVYFPAPGLWAQPHACLNWLDTSRLEVRRSLECLVLLAWPSWTSGFALRKAWLAGSLLRGGIGETWGAERP